MIIKLLVYLESATRNNFFKFKGLLLKIYLKVHKCKVGRNLRCHKLPVLRTIPHGNITLGNNVTIGNHITFEVTRTGKIIIGDYVKLTQNILISSGKEVRIEDYAIFGENISIRDGEHKTSKSIEIANQDSEYQSINIGRDVWIGAGSIILKGANIPGGVVIGANSVVTSSSRLQANNIYAGSPVHLIKAR
jgi:acetyltransferase-like isoleucine patch superfamily enzyme